MYEYYSIISHLFIFSDLMAWVNSMQASLSSQELASNVSGAERLLNKHKVKILCSVKDTLHVHMYIPYSRKFWRD